MGILGSIGKSIASNAGSLLGGAVGAAGSLVGGSIANRANQKYADSTWQKNYDAQKEFAQNSIQWRVQDAQKAGVHPIYAVGGNMPGYTPQDASYSDSFGNAVSQGMNRLGDSLGQLNLASVKEDVVGKKLDNNKKALELANKAIRDNLGQVPKIFPDVIKDTTGAKMFSTGDGSISLVPDADMEWDNLPAVKQAIATMFDREAHAAIAKENNQDLGLGLGYSTIPKSDKSWWSNAKRDTSDSVPKVGHLVSMLLGPSTTFRHMIGGIERYFRQLNKKRSK